MNNKLFSRDDEQFTDSNKRVNWLDSFADNYESLSKQTKIEASSYLEQLKQIIDNNYGAPKHATVESKVNDYKERTGLNKYLNKDTVKQASQDISSKEILNDIDPKLKDKIIMFVKNKCKSTEGRLPVAAILDEILSLFTSEGLSPSILDSKELINFIHQTNEQYKKEMPNDYRHLGLENSSPVEDDGSNSDFFHNFHNIK